jgi:hypothetical protein
MTRQIDYSLVLSYDPQDILGELDSWIENNDEELLELAEWWKAREYSDLLRVAHEAIGSDELWRIWKSNLVATLTERMGALKAEDAK